MVAKKTHKAPARIRKPDEVADATIARLVQESHTAGMVDSDLWKRVIAAEVRVFAQEIIQAAGATAKGCKTGTTPAQLQAQIVDALLEAAS